MFAAALACLPALLPAPSETPQHDIYRCEEDVAAPSIDGLLDDAIWGRAHPLSPLTMVEPEAGPAPSERTEVLLAYDARNLYIALRCFDSDPSGIRATQMKRDADLDPDDRVEILIDTFLDRRNGFWFQISPAGSKGDALITKNGTFNKRWDGIWHGKARITGEGWQAELAIPMETLNFDPAGGSWGFNLRRIIRRKNEEDRWASPEPRIRFFSVANAGTLVGLQGLEQGLGLDLKPFGVGSYIDDHETGDIDRLGDAGLDVFYRVTPRTKLSLSYNTDFAETEVDSRRANLTRFPLFFPEKRDFFLEDSGAFVFGPSGERDVVPFFSRRIGLDDNGNEVPLLLAGKVTGQTDAYSFGMLDVQTDDTGELDDRNLFAGRFSKNIFEQSDVGVIWTHGDPTEAGRSDTVGADLNLRTDSFQGDRNLQLSAFIVKTDNEGVDSDDLAWHAGLAYPNDEIDWSVDYTVIQDNFSPQLGFSPRTGIRKYTGVASWRPRQHDSIRRLIFSLRPSLITSTEGRTESVRLGVTPFGVDWESGESLRVYVDRYTENLDEDFEISDGVEIPEDDYDYTRGGFDFWTSDKREFSGSLDVSLGEFYDGHREDYEFGLEWRPSRHALFETEYEHTDVRLPGGDFDINIARLQIELLWDPTLSWTSYIQWDDVSDSVGVNSRLWKIFEPGREAFLVLNQGWDVEDEHMVPTRTSLTLKLGYTLRI